MKVGIDEIIYQVVDELKTPRDPFKDYAPVIKTENGYSIYITDDIVEPSEYNRVVHTLRNATEEDAITVYVTSNGGCLDTADYLGESIRQSKATITGKAAGTVASAGTLILLSCDIFDITNTSSWLFHEGTTYSGPAKSSDASDFQAFYRPQLANILKAYYGELLSAKEYKSILTGKEFWLGGEDVKARLKKIGKIVI